MATSEREQACAGLEPSCSSSPRVRETTKFITPLYSPIACGVTRRLLLVIGTVPAHVFVNPVRNLTPISGQHQRSGASRVTSFHELIERGHQRLAV